MGRGQPSARTALKREALALREMERARNKRKSLSSGVPPADNGGRADPTLAAGPGAVAPNSSGMTVLGDKDGRVGVEPKLAQPRPSGAAVNIAELKG
jgi:hypothetical protein